MPTVQTYLTYASLQMAAEALLERPGSLAERLQFGNNRSSKFTSTQATQFAAEWEVVAHQPNTNTGFSGTLFRCRVTDESRGLRQGDLVMSFRSTEFIDDSVRDNMATNKMEIAEGGWAIGQIADMERWYRELSYPQDAREAVNDSASPVDQRRAA